MKSLLVRPKMRQIFAGSLLSVIVGSPLAIGGQGASTSPFAAAYGKSRALFAAGDIADAEATLFATNHHGVGTAAWHLEAAQALVMAALDFRSAGQNSEAVLLGRRALAQLALAEQKATAADGAAMRACIQMLAGVVNEQLSGNTALARQYYQAAVQIDPKSPAAARLARLNRAAAEVANRAAAGAGHGG